MVAIPPLDARRLLRRLPIGYKILLPFLALTLASGLMFAVVAALDLAAGTTAQADTLLLRQGDATSQRIASIGASQLVALRLLSGTAGLSDAVQSGDRQAIESLVFPMLTSQPPLLNLRVSVLSPDGTELLTLRPDPADAHGCVCTYGRRVSAWSNLPSLNAGETGAGVANDIDGPVAFTVGPILAAGGTAGAIIVAQPLKALVDEVGRGGNLEVALFYADGSSLAASPGFPHLKPLSAPQRAQVVAGQVIRPARPASTADDLLFVPWKLAGSTVGYVGLAIRPVATGYPGGLAILLCAIFLAAIAVCLLGGVFISRAISRPLSRLVEATKDIAGGRAPAHPPIEGEDEVGRLAVSFNQMVKALGENRAALERSMDGILATLAAAIDARDPYTNGHSHRVADYAMALGASLGLSSPALGLLRRACLIHDIGKIGIPDHVLLKAGPLTAEERQSLQAHPVIGFRVLRHLAWEPEVLDVVRSHHERWDGGGYPDGLSGTQVPQLARVASLADALDAMVSERVYRPGMSFEQAREEIRLGSGSQFDPAVVKAFMAVQSQIQEMVEGPAGSGSGQAPHRIAV